MVGLVVETLELELEAAGVEGEIIVEARWRRRSLQIRRRP